MDICMFTGLKSNMQEIIHNNVLIYNSVIIAEHDLKYKTLVYCLKKEMVFF